MLYALYILSSTQRPEGVFELSTMPSHIKGFRRSVPGVINVRPATPDQPPTLDTKNLAAGLSANKALTKKAPKTASALTKGLFLSATHGTKKAVRAHFNNFI